MSAFEDQYRAFLARRERGSVRRSGRGERTLENLMASIDFESTLARLGIEVRPCGRGEYVGYCPDHAKYKGVPPSDPKWYINSETGLTYCQTEGRGSNLVEVAEYVWGIDSWSEAYDRLLDGRPVEIARKVERLMAAEESRLSEEAEAAEKLRKSLDAVRGVLDEGPLDREAIAWFAKDDIREETLRKLGVCSCRYGSLRDRAIVPFFDSKMQLCGYIGIDLLGKEVWSRRRAEQYLKTDDTHPLAEVLEAFRKRYRKTVYAPGFQSRKHLYGLYENLSLLESRPKSLLLVEGERDCMKMFQEGVPCVSCHGTFLKDGQVNLLKTSGLLAGLDEIFLGFDMDEAGDAAVERTFLRLRDEFDEDRIYSADFPPDAEGNKRDPKKFSGGEMAAVLEEARKAGRHNRRERREE